MSLIKNIVVIVLCLSISLIGMPAHAHEQCLHSHSSTHADAHQGHEHLAGNAAHHHKNCADHDKCCMGCSINLALLSDTNTPVHAPASKGQVLQALQTLLISSLLQTQDRPPKYLS